MATQEEVALHINVSIREFRNLTKLPGSPTPRGRGGYDVDAWRLFYIELLRKKSRSISRDEKPENDDERDDERDIRLQNARIRLTEAQAYAQELKNLKDEKLVVDTEFCSFALSRLANDISAILDSIPLSMQRRFVDMDEAQLNYLKVSIAKAMNAAVMAGEKIPGALDEYLERTAQ